ncbi:MAG TPA: histidinol-phosphatase [Thermoanaerobaculia bacterium]|nr:histidinol-phosphatase [Thermoanaerobaculia bacterium]
MHDDLALALALADAADAITMKFFGAPDLAVRAKNDLSPVSEADEAAERAMRDLLRQQRPADGILGEEFGTTGTTDRRWILDPIDGTRNYVRGVPVFATLIALEERGRLTTGVVSAPAMKRRWRAARGDGAFCNGNRIRVSTVASLHHAFIGYDSITDFDPLGLESRFLDLLRACDRSRGFGDFWTHMLVAEGAIDLAIEPKVALWDVAPVQVIVEEAGGRFTTLSGRPDADGGSGVSSNGILHDAALGFFR